MVTRLLLTAVSQKTGGVCLAGLTEAGDFIRPIDLDGFHFAIPEAWIERGFERKKLMPLDVVTMFLDDVSAGQGIRSEDRQCTSGFIKFEKSVDFREVLKNANFRKKVTQPVWFLDDTAHFLRAVPANRPSLALVLAESVRITPRPNDPQKHHIAFTAQNRRYERFALTDLRHAELFAMQDSGAKYWLCVSLGQDWDAHDGNRNYKLVAGMWPAE